MATARQFVVFVTVIMAMGGVLGNAIPRISNEVEPIYEPIKQLQMVSEQHSEQLSSIDVRIDTIITELDELKGRLSNQDVALNGVMDAVENQHVVVGVLEERLLEVEDITGIGAEDSDEEEVYNEEEKDEPEEWYNEEEEEEEEDEEEELQKEENENLGELVEEGEEEEEEEKENEEEEKEEEEEEEELEQEPRVFQPYGEGARSAGEESDYFETY